MDESVPKLVVLERMKEDEYFDIEEEKVTLTTGDTEFIGPTQEGLFKEAVKRGASAECACPLLESGHTKRRRKRFTNLEILALIREVEKRKDIVRVFNTKSHNSEDRRHAWAHVTARVNKVGEGKRQVSEVRKKYIDFRSLVKKKLARFDAQQSGNSNGLATPEELTPVEKAMAATLDDTPTKNFPDFPASEDVLPESGKSPPSCRLLAQDEMAGGEADKTCISKQYENKLLGCLTQLTVPEKCPTNKTIQQEDDAIEKDIAVQRTMATQTPPSASVPATPSQDTCQSCQNKLKSLVASDTEKDDCCSQERRDGARQKDDLDYFFLSLCELTRRLSRRKQNRVKKDLLNLLVQAEEEEEV